MIHTGQSFKTTRVLLLSRLIMIGLLVHGTVEVVHAASGTFALTGSLNTARYDHTATLLPNGQVLVTGGTDVNTKALYTYSGANHVNLRWTAWNMTRVSAVAAALVS